MNSPKKRGPSYWWNYLGHLLRIRRELPSELADQFEVYKDIKSIDRIGISSWIGFALTLCLFGLDWYRQKTGVYDTSPYFKTLHSLHLIGLLFLPLAIHVSLHKKWIVQNRLRRGIVIWGMVLLAFAFLFSQAVVVYLHRSTGVMFLGFVFTATWMFSMSHKERILFLAVTCGVMGYFLITQYANIQEALALQLKPEFARQRANDLIFSNFIEIVFLSVIAFAFDAFDYNAKLTNFLNSLKIDQEQKRINQLEEFKSRFFTNLTHEFRTPLTTIIGMSKEIASNPNRWHKEGTDMIRKNAENLLKLVNQVLDVSKIESGTMSLHLVQGDIISFTSYIIDSFKGYALNKKIGLHFICSEDKMIMDYDPEKYTAILSNLLSNAIKFSAEGENVYITLGTKEMADRNYLEVSIKDNGIGIPKEELNLIFERFYQVENEMSSSGIGTGVGLSLVKELVQLFNGQVDVVSSLGKGTKFSVALPIHHSAPMSDDLLEIKIRETLSRIDSGASIMEDDRVENDQPGKPEILVIEDNKDVLRYIQICLHDLYIVHTAVNGKEGVDSAIKNVPDLVLCDVLMPVKDGLTACRELKKHPATSHIPFILLSAKADPASRIAGLESGADVYMTKPFEKDELRIQIQNLLDRFTKLHERYAGVQELKPESAPVPHVEMEDEFITKIRTLVLDHLDDTEFSVNDIERGVFLSRSQLHKKLKALTGLSAMQFVNRMRLAAAFEKLKSPDLTISDIAYQVGYSDPNYFSRAYADQFGESPSETRKKFKGNGI